jgi:hypothetical protein
MTSEANAVSTRCVEVVKAQGEEPALKAGDAVRISVRFPIGHFRVPTYIRGKRGWIESVVLLWFGTAFIGAGFVLHLFSSGITFD